MLIIGCDLHTRFQQIAMLDTETGEIRERRLEHATGEAQRFYAALAAPARVGMEATGYARWFERMLAEQGHQLWIGDARAIRAARVRQQKTDARDAQLLLRLLVEDRFPRIWVSSPAERDTWQLLRHRDKLVRWRTAVRNQLHALAMGEGLCRKKKLWSKRGRQELEALTLGPWAGRRRQELLEMLDRLDGSIEEWDQPCSSKRSVLRWPCGCCHRAAWGRLPAWPWRWRWGRWSGFGTAASWSAIWGCIPARPAAAANSGWGPAASKATRWCGGCWWKRRRRPPGRTRFCGEGTNAGCTAAVGRWRRWPSLANWRCGGMGNSGTPERRRPRRLARRVARQTHWSGQLDRCRDGAPCLPGKNGSSEKQSWSERAGPHRWLMEFASIIRLQEYEPWEETAQNILRR